MLHPDPVRDIDRLAAQLLGTSPGSARVPLAMPMDLYRSGDHYVLHADLPGVDPDSVDVSVDGGSWVTHFSATSASHIANVRNRTLRKNGMM